MTRRDAILAQVHAMPALPTGAGQVIGMLQDPELDLNDLIKRIEHDPGLTSNLLRLANSAYFAGPRSIATIRDAIVRLGTARILQLVVTSTVAPMARKPVLGYDLPAGQLLEHSVAVAVAVEVLSEALSMGQDPQLFTVGLLHDIGKIVLGSFVKVDAGPIRQMAAEESIGFDVAEARVLGIDHAEVGATLLAAWGLPHSLVEVVRMHHRPDDVTDRGGAADLVHVADVLVLSSGVGAGYDGLNYRLSEHAIARIGFTTSVGEVVMSKTMSALEDLRSVLGAN